MCQKRESINLELNLAENKAMKICLISGSHRKSSESERLGEYMASRCAALFSAQTHCLHLGSNPLPLWNESFPVGDEWSEWRTQQPEIANADGLVIITPEWGGMATPAIKNFFLLASKGELAHKPALLVAISSTRGGAFPIAELRSSSLKNTGIVYLPEHLIIRNSSLHGLAANLSLKGPHAPGSSAEEQDYLSKRVDFALRVLVSYAECLTPMRKKYADLFHSYPFGMS